MKMPTKASKRDSEPEDDDDDEDETEDDADSTENADHPEDDKSKSEGGREAHDKGATEEIPVWATKLQQQVSELGESLTSLRESNENAKKPKPKRKAPVLEVAKPEEPPTRVVDRNRRVIKLW